MNVLHLDRFFYSSRLNHVFSLVHEQQRQGHEARLVMEGCPPYQLLKLYDKKLEKLQATLIRPGDQVTLLQRARQFHPDIIHAHSPELFALAAALADNLGTPLVITCHGLGLNRYEYRPFLQKAGAIICTSRKVASSLREFSHKIYIIPGGIDLEEFRPGPKSEPVKIALIMRIGSSRQNACKHFCKAVDLLEGVEFYVAADKKPASVKASFLGWTDKIPELLARTDIMAGTGRTIVEGLSTGNVAIVLGRTYQGILTPDKVEKQWDLSGLSGSDPCYKTIFFDLAKLCQNLIYLRQLQKFSRSLAEKEFDNRKLTGDVIAVYSKVMSRAKK